jgi:hypothetical protein
MNQADFKRVEAVALDSCATYDFFVTAWHLVEGSIRLRPMLLDERRDLPARRSCASAGISPSVQSTSSRTGHDTPAWLTLKRVAFRRRRWADYT